MGMLSFRNRDKQQAGEQSPPAAPPAPTEPENTQKTPVIPEPTGLPSCPTCGETFTRQSKYDKHVLTCGV